MVEDGRIVAAGTPATAQASIDMQAAAQAAAAAERWYAEIRSHAFAA